MTKKRNITVSGYIRAEYTRFGLYSGRVYLVRVNSGRFEAGRNRVDLRRVGIRSILERLGFESGSGCPFWVHFGSGSLWVWVNFGFRLVMNRFTSGVRVQISSTHFGCWFGYGTGSIGSGFEFRVSFTRSPTRQVNQIDLKSQIRTVCWEWDWNPRHFGPEL